MDGGRWLPAGNRLLAAVLSGALLATALSVAPAGAAAAVSVDEDALANQIFSGLAQARFAAAGGTVGLVQAVTVSADFLEWRRLHPAAALADAQADLANEQQLLADGLTAVDRQRDEPGLMLRAIDVLSAPGGSPALSASHIRAIVGGVAGSAVGALDSREDLSEGALANLSWQRARSDILASLWADVRHTAQGDAVFAQAWNSALGAPASMDAAAPLDQLKAADELTGRVDVDRLLSLTGSPDALLAEAQAQIGAVFAGLSTLAGAATAQAAAQAANCPANAPVVSPACTPANEQAAGQKAKEQKSEADRYKAALDAIDPILKAVDPDLENQVKTVGGAIITTVKAISTYADDISKIADVSGKIFSLATVTMTGNIFGAVMSVAGLFGSSTPSISKQILDRVKALQDQVKSLHAEMTESFKRIDARLNTIYNTMVAEFDKLNAAIEGNTAQLALLQQNVAELGLRLEEVTASILNAIGQAELVNVRGSIDKYIGYAEQFGMPIPTFSPDYIGAETDLHLASTQLAGDTAFLVPAADADNPALDPTTVLNTNGETKSINYLAGLAAKRDAAIAPPTAPVGNAGVWGLGAQGYSLLQLQNPDYARMVASSRATDIEVDGQRILDLAASFAHPVAAPDADGDHRNDLFTSLDADYRAGVADFSSAMRTIRTNDVLSRYEPTADGVQIKTAKNYDLFWNGTSALPTDPPVPADPATIDHCVGTQQISRTANVSFTNLPVQVKFLNYAYTPENGVPAVGVRELPEVSICEQPSWVDTRVEDVPGSGVLRTHGHLRLDVLTRYRINPGAAWQNAVDTAYTWPDEVVFDVQCTIFHCHTHTDPETQLNTVWPAGGSTDFLVHAVRTVNAGVVAGATTTINQFLTSRQRFMYDSIGAALGSASSASALAVRKMNTARRLLQAYTQLGLPIAVQSDELLSSLLLGQFKLLGDLPTEPTVTDALHTASDNYSSCGTSCLVDAGRPIQNQTFYDPSEPACAASTAGPGDPLGNCLIEIALRRETNLSARLEVHFKQLSAGDYVEQLPSVATTLEELKVSDRLSHAPAVTAGVGNLSGTVGQSVSLDLNHYTSGGKAPYTFTATGLPQGLTLGTDGVVGGTPTTSGTSTVAVTAHDASGAAGNAYTFSWHIGVVVLPDVRGLGWGLAKAALGRAGFPVASISPTSDCTRPSGTVDSQTPAANTEVAAGSAGSTPVSVVYTLCADDAPVVTPSVASTGQVAVTWTDRSTGEDAFVVSRHSTGGQFVSQAGERLSGTRTGTGGTYTFTDTTPSANAPCYRVEAHLSGDDIVLTSTIGCLPPVVAAVPSNGTPLAVARRVDGRLEAMAADGQGRTYLRWQTAPGGPWSAWNAWGGDATQLAMVGNADGHLEVFGTNPAGVAAGFTANRVQIVAVTTTGQIRTRWQLAGGGWSDWTGPL